MAENIIYYGPPGTGKTYLLQNKMRDYIDYQVSDAQIIKAYQSETKEWILISLIMIQSHGKMKPSEIQTKIDSLKLGKRVSVASVLEAHSMNVALADIIRKTPQYLFRVWGWLLVCEQNQDPAEYAGLFREVSFIFRS